LPPMTSACQVCHW